ncbi:hypothetical protein GA0115255_104462, partial [Streptomyces sp. Ncost-T6T-2b]
MLFEEARGLRGDVRDDGAERRELVEGDAQPGKSSRGGVLLGAAGQPFAQEDGEHRVRGQLRHTGVAQPLTASVAEAADVPSQEVAEGRVPGDGGEIPPPGRVVGEPLAQREAVRPPLATARFLVVRLGHGDSGGQAEVEKVQVGGGLPAALDSSTGRPSARSRSV